MGFVTDPCWVTTMAGPLLDAWQSDTRTSCQQQTANMTGANRNRGHWTRSKRTSVGASVGANVGAVVLDAMIFSLSKFANPSSFVQFSSTGSAAAYAAYEHKLTAARRRTGKRAIGDGGRERRARRDGARWARSSRRR